jgi:hypothetical protein
MFFSDIDENGFAVFADGGYPSGNHLGSKVDRRVIGGSFELGILEDEAVKGDRGLELGVGQLVIGLVFEECLEPAIVVVFLLVGLFGRKVGFELGCKA